MKYFGLLLALSPIAAVSQTLTTNPPNNGSGGVFMEITDLSGIGLVVHEFDTTYAGASGNNANIEVWTRPGTYAGFTGSNVGWTLHETAIAVTPGLNLFAPINMVNEILIGAGQTTSVYLHSVSAGFGIRYTGTGAGGHQTLFSNVDLSLFSDVSRTGAIAFAGTQFSPRTFSGSVHYRVAVPEPATIGVLAVGIALLALRTRRP